MTRLALTLLLAAAVCACAEGQQAATEVKSAVQAAATPTLSTADAAFLNGAARGGITEVTFGQLARTQGSRAAVRDYGLRMTTEHTTLNQQITQLAAVKQITPTTTVDVAHQATYDRIAALRGRSFDHAYLDGQVAEHTAMVAAFEAEAAQGQDADVRAYAAKTVPMLKAHLGMARHLGGKLPPDAP